MQSIVIASIGIPTYNNSETIAETIHSLKAQTFRDWECFICDDSESDETFDSAKLAISDDPRFTLIRNEVRLGAAGNWNKTLSLASGKYFKLLCADDLLTSNALQIQVQTLNENSASVLCTGKRNIVNSKGRTILRDRGFSSLKGEYPVDVVARKFVRTGSNFFGEPSFALYRTKDLIEAGGFDSNWSYLIDVVSYFSVLDRGSFSPVNETLGSFRISSTSWSARLSKKQKEESLECLNYVANLGFVSTNRLELLLGKFRSTIASYARRAVFRFLG